MQGAEFSMGQRGGGEAWRVGVGVGAGEDGGLLAGLPGRDFIHDKRLFRCAGKGVPRRLAPFLLLLLSDDCEAGEVYRVGA